mmetsp:Transcript_66993/g.111303  ORF Transcript_66993/g.111303 Transcript_66993/m.111303 type:complete len:279 (+) Transcript_66993:508-1344(+)
MFIARILHPSSPMQFVCSINVRNLMLTSASARTPSSPMRFPCRCRSLRFGKRSCVMHEASKASPWHLKSLLCRKSRSSWLSGPALVRTLAIATASAGPSFHVFHASSCFAFTSPALVCTFRKNSSSDTSFKVPWDGGGFLPKKSSTCFAPTGTTDHAGRDSSETSSSSTSTHCRSSAAIGTFVVRLLYCSTNGSTTACKKLRCTQGASSVILSSTCWQRTPNCSFFGRGSPKLSSTHWVASFTTASVLKPLDVIPSTPSTSTERRPSALSGILGFFLL